MNKIIGRDSNCDYVIIDPKNRVSRRHAEVQKKDNIFFIKDLNSLNGTFINGTKINSGQFIRVTKSDRVTLSIDYTLNIFSIFLDDDSTKVFSKQTYDNQSTVVFENSKGTFRDGKKVFEFDRDKTQLGDILEMDKSPFITIGRSTDNKIVVNNSNVSRYHCRIRLITPVMLEFEDLGSTNGSFADEEKLIPNKKYQFASSVSLRLGVSYVLNLKILFPNIHILQKVTIPKKEPIHTNSINNMVLSQKEKQSFNELEAIWKEFQDRQNQANNASTGYGIGGAVLGIVASVFLAPVTGGASIIGTVATAGGGLLGRYLGQQQSSKIRNDLTYEDAFLQTYACPRCSESFEKKPWITIRECFKCKVKFR
jgi:pSer/pThr/pTyr-binding forkhead associated (FHA) protein